MRKLIAIALVCTFAVSLSLAQESSNSSIVKEFTRSGQTEGLTWNFVLLNDRTVDALFQAPGKYAMRARANQSTTFYVQGTPEKDVQVDPRFEVEQDGKVYACTAHNIKNLVPGKALKGNRIDGILQLDQKLDLARPFKIKGSGNLAVEYKLAADAMKLAMPLPRPPATPASAPQP